MCARCHDRLGGGVQIGATGEFRVPHDVLEDLAEPAAPVPDATRTCSWCGKAAEQVRKLLGTGAVAICDECVSLCADIMEAELGPDWR